MKDKTRLLITILILLLAVGMFVLGMIILPDVIVMQMKADGTVVSTMPKLIGLLIPLALSVVFAVFFYKGGKGKYLLVAIIGLFALGATFFLNR
jgi:hypothetical protein